MSSEKKHKAEKHVEKKADYKVGDYLELEFEFGELEFEATGKSAVVEKLFRLLIDKICSGELKVFEESEEDEEEEEEKEKEEKEEKEEEPEEEEEKIEEEASSAPGPDWDSLDSESPPESPSERDIGDE
jgi:hypothetical protein